MQAQVQRRPQHHTRCPYCHDAVESEDDRSRCRTCAAPHHKECWAELGKCSTCGAILSEAAGGRPFAKVCNVAGCSLEGDYWFGDAVESQANLRCTYHGLREYGHALLGCAIAFLLFLGLLVGIGEAIDDPIPVFLRCMFGGFIALFAILGGGLRLAAWYTGHSLDQPSSPRPKSVMPTDGSTSGS